MTTRGRILSLLITLAATFGLSLTAAPAQAVTYGSFKICASALTTGSTNGTMYVYDTDGSSGNYWISHNSDVAPRCTPWLYPPGVRVEVDPYGGVASFKVMIGTSATWASRPCHNHDNDYDPPNPSSGQSYEVWIRGFDHANCVP